MVSAAASPPQPAANLRHSVRSAVIWRSGSQVFAQLLAWAATFLVIRILAPADYGLYAMAAVVMTLLNLFNGYGFANAAIQAKDGGEQVLRQLFGILILVNAALAALQIAAAPLVAAYYRNPMVAELLRVQALIYLTNPFLALGYAVLARQMDFRRQARVNVIAAVLGALTALAGAYSGWGVWTLVAAPLVGFTARAFGMAAAARAWMWPSFELRGMGGIASFGGTIMAGQIFWFAQSQADVVIAGRVFNAAQLGYYTTALFLAQIFVTKIVPPLNEVAFSAYSRIQDRPEELAAGFLKAVRLVMLAGMPFCLGLAAVAPDAVAVALGARWAPSAPLVRLLALAMPFMTLQVMFAPAATARGRPGIATRSSMLGAVLMPVSYLVGVRFGAAGLAAAWLAAYPLLTACTAAWTLPVIAIRWREWIEACRPPVLAGAAMALAVILARSGLDGVRPLPRLLLLTTLGVVVYLGWLCTFARARLNEAIGLARGG